MKYWFLVVLLLPGCGSNETPKINSTTTRSNSDSRRTQNWTRTANAIPPKPVTLLCEGFVGVARGEKYHVNERFGWSGNEPREVLLSDSDLRDSGRVVVRLKPENDGLSPLEIAWDGIDGTRRLTARGVIGSPLALQHTDAKGVRRELAMSCKVENVDVPFLEEPLDLECTGSGFDKRPVRWDGRAAKKIVLFANKPGKKSGEISISFTPSKGATAKTPESPAMIVLSLDRVGDRFKATVSTAATFGRAYLELKDSAAPGALSVECQHDRGGSAAR